MPIDDNPLWYKDAIIYEVHVRAFFDSNGDGIGDFPGLTSRLDYLQDLGVTALWLLPFYPSPLRDDGYDTADYTAIHPAYGTMNDFRVFLREAHRRGLRVITELVVNHTSDQHPWFQRARRARPGTAARDFYVWSDTPEKYGETRIIFQDYETSNWTWDPVAQSYYWHRFFHHQPDLNYDNPQVRKAIFKVLDFWMNLGVDGMRLDAVPYLFEREGTNCENLPETHAFLKDLRRHVDQRYRNRMFLAEANQWPEDAVAYLGDECHMAFHFPVMPRMFMAVRMEDRFPIVDILEQTPAIPETNQWALFLRNHDELTLEMVTDEERDYMYRVYAHESEARINVGIRRRLAPLMNNQRRKLELMNGLLFSMPGTPILYYGDEIGLGDNIYLGDRNGVRTPMQWNGDRNAGFSTANPQKLFLPVNIDPEYHYEAVNVEAQQKNPQSLLWWQKRLIALRKHYKAFSRGSIEFLHPENMKVLAFIREFEDERILVVANLSRFAQYAELDLSPWAGSTPVELFGHTEFPPVIADRPYLLTLSPHGFLWFHLQAAREPAEVAPTLPRLSIDGAWGQLFTRERKAPLERLLPDYLNEVRWFSAKARRIKGVTLRDVVVIPGAAVEPRLLVLHVEFREGDPLEYLLPVTYVTGKAARDAREHHRPAILAEVAAREGGRNGEGLLVDASIDPHFGEQLLAAMERRRVFRGFEGEVTAWSSRAYRQLRGAEPIPATVLRAEQSNTSIVFGDRFILKLIRRMEAGENPELEIGRFLTDRREGVNVPAVAGALEYRRAKEEPITLGILETFVPNEGNAWDYTLDELGRFFERALALARSGDGDPEPPPSMLSCIDLPAPDQYLVLTDTFYENLRLLGIRTAEFHKALASDPDHLHFRPEPFTTLYQRGVYQSLRNSTSQLFQQLRRRLRTLPDSARADAEAVLGLENRILEKFRGLLDVKVEATRLRVHGDYHLGQVLYTGKDFVIIDFEGEPLRSVTERRIKRSPLRDVAGMMRSFHYAVRSWCFLETGQGLIRDEEQPDYQAWARYWYQWTSGVFLAAYLEAVGEASFIPKQRRELSVLLDSYLLEKAVYELAYELNNRPSWIRIPLEGLQDLVA